MEEEEEQEVVEDMSINKYIGHKDLIYTLD